MFTIFFTLRASNLEGGGGDINFNYRADGDYKYYGGDSLVKLIQNWIFLWFPHIQGSPILKKVICDFGEDNSCKNV